MLWWFVNHKLYLLYYVLALNFPSFTKLANGVYAILNSVIISEETRYHMCMLLKSCLNLKRSSITNCGRYHQQLKLNTSVSNCFLLVQLIQQYHGHLIEIQQPFEYKSYCTFSNFIYQS